LNSFAIIIINRQNS